MVNIMLSQKRVKKGKAARFTSSQLVHSEPSEPVAAACEPEKIENLRWVEIGLTFSVVKAATLAKVNPTYFYRLFRNSENNPLKTIKIAGKTRIYAESLFERYPQAAENYKAEIERQNSLTVNKNEAAERLAQEAARKSQPAHPPAEIVFREKTDRDNARAWHLNRFKVFQAACGRCVGEASVLYIEAFKRGELDAPDWVMAAHKDFCSSTLQRWLRKEKKVGAAALVYHYNGNTNSHWTRHPEQERFAESLLLQRPHVSGTLLREALAQGRP